MKCRIFVLPAKSGILKGFSVVGVLLGCSELAEEEEKILTSQSGWSEIVIFGGFMVGMVVLEASRLWQCWYRQVVSRQTLLWLVKTDDVILENLGEGFFYIFFYMCYKNCIKIYQVTHDTSQNIKFLIKLYIKGILVAFLIKEQFGQFHNQFLQWHHRHHYM